MKNFVRMHSLCVTTFALAACGQINTYVEADPVVKGVRFKDQIVPLGPIDMIVQVAGKNTRHVQQYFFVPVESAGDDPSPNSLGMTIGFIARVEGANVKLRSGTLYYGEKRKPAHAVAVYPMMGYDKGCSLPLDRNSAQPVWFDTSVSNVSWSCRYIKFSVPGYQAYDRLELVLDRLEINDTPVDVQPINFVLHAEDSFSSH